MKQLWFVLSWFCLVPQVMASDGFFYAGAALGDSVLDSGELTNLIHDGSISGVSYDKSDISYELILGARFHQNLYGEVSYAKLGDFKVDGRSDGSVIHAAQSITGTLDINALKLALIANKHIGRATHLYLRGGLYQSWAESQVTSQSSDTQSGNGIHYGLGLGYIFSSRWQVQLDWTRYRDIDYTIPHAAQNASAVMDTFSVRWLRMF